MKMTRAIIATAAAFALATAACSGSGGSATADPSAGGGTSAASVPAGAKPLKVGFTASKTGGQQLPSSKQVEGIQLWADTVTKAGGIKLKDGTVLMPELVSYDDESKADRVQSLYTRLINTDGVDVLLSPYSSGLVKAAAVVTEQNGKVMVTAGGADDATMEQGFTGIYQVYTPASKYLTGAIDLALSLDPTIKRLAIVNEKDAFSTSVVAAAEPYAQSKGLEIVLSEGYDSGTTDFAPFIDKIAAANPDAIIGGGHFQDGQTFAKQLYDKGVPARFVALLVAPPEPTFADIGDAAVGIVGPSQWEPSVAYSESSASAAGVPYYGLSVADFTKAFGDAYGGEKASYHAAGGYAAGLILQKAIEDAGGTDPAALKKALDAIDLESFFGRTKFSTDAQTHGKQVAHEMVYVQWQKGADGKLESRVVWPATAKSADAQLRTVPAK